MDIPSVILIVLLAVVIITGISQWLDSRCPWCKKHTVEHDSTYMNWCSNPACPSNKVKPHEYL